MPWAKVNYLCHLSIFICAASENVWAMRKSIYNHACVHNFINVMCEFMHDMRYLIRCMFSFICDMSQFISTYKGIFMLGNCLSGANELSSKRIRLSMVDCWIECCNSDHLVKYLGS